MASWLRKNNCANTNAHPRHSGTNHVPSANPSRQHIELSSVNPLKSSNRGLFVRTFTSNVSLVMRRSGKAAQCEKKADEKNSTTAVRSQRQCESGCGAALGLRDTSAVLPNMAALFGFSAPPPDNCSNKCVLPRISSICSCHLKQVLENARGHRKEMDEILHDWNLRRALSGSFISRRGGGGGRRILCVHEEWHGLASCRAQNGSHRKNCRCYCCAFFVSLTS